ncbi:hypothetical protein WJX72_000849 [[Myrmecia] bisecta]|uniref:Cationic amino acid transporter n=1 Tax=[Myrmecia] bisecta TaxID=41462 RepID=A0AAW1PA97_9CHLO
MMESKVTIPPAFEGPQVFSSAERFLGAPPSQYLKVWQMPKRFAAMAFTKRQVEEQREHNRRVSNTELKKQLTWFSFCSLGVGIIVATGIFSFMPYIYAFITGPSVVISLIIAAAAAALSALLYSEFAVEYPVLGGGFVYVLNVFGEFPAVLCATNLVIDYLFSTAAVVRNFAVYIAALFNLQDASDFQKSVSFQTDPIDWLALLVVMVLTVALLFSMKIFDESNIFLQVIHVGLVLFTIIAAFTQAQPSNWTPFFPTVGKTDPTIVLSPSGARTILTGASNIFFVFIGYDVIALGAEEAKNDWAVPIGMISSVGVVSVIYVLMAVSLVMLIPWDVLAAQPGDVALSGFAYAFTYRGMAWAKYIVALGAAVGIFTSTGIGIYGLSRVFTTFAREGMIPAFVAWVPKRTGTPFIATLAAGLACGLMAFFTSFATLANMTSIGTLAMYYFVALAHIYRRYCPEFESLAVSGDRQLAVKFRPDPFKNILGVAGKKVLLLAYLAAITGCAIGFTLFWNLSLKNGGLIGTAVAFVVVTLCLQFTLPIEYVPAKFSVPPWMMPWAPALSLWANVMLIGGFGAHKSDYVRLFVAMGIGTVIYLFFGLPTSWWRFHGAGKKDTVPLPVGAIGSTTGAVGTRSDSAHQGHHGD